MPEMTPLEKARKRETEYCNEAVFVGGAFYCEKSGKLIHPMALTEDGRCRNKKSCKYLKEVISCSSAERDLKKN